jgi:hypothetical protein
MRYKFKQTRNKLGEAHMSTLYGGVYSPGRFFHVEISVKKFK